MNKIINTDEVSSYTIICNKCKSIEDTFYSNENDKPEDYGWINHRKKWHCPSCSKIRK